jgi:hypothetical protein
MTAALAGSALLATAAIAQTPKATMDNGTKTSPSTMDKTKAAPTNTASTSDSSYHGDWRVSKVIGLNVYNTSNEKLGSISELLFDKSGSVKAAVIGVGGFLGVGQHDVAVAFDKLKFVDTPVPSTSASTSTSSRPGTTTGAAPSTSSKSTSMSSTTKSNPWYPDHAIFEATKDQLKSMPQFKYST